jgi:hypothetical protein
MEFRFCILSGCFRGRFQPVDATTLATGRSRPEADNHIQPKYVTIEGMRWRNITYAVVVLLAGTAQTAFSQEAELDTFTRRSESAGRFMNWTLHHNKMHSESTYRCRSACVWGSPTGRDSPTGRFCVRACAPDSGGNKYNAHFSPGYNIKGEWLRSRRLFVKVDGDLPIDHVLNQATGGTWVSQQYGERYGPRQLVDRLINGRKLYLHIGAEKPRQYDYVFFLPGFDDAIEWIDNVTEDVPK